MPAFFCHVLLLFPAHLCDVCDMVWVAGWLGGWVAGWLAVYVCVRSWAGLAIADTHPPVRPIPNGLQNDYHGISIDGQAADG